MKAKLVKNGFEPFEIKIRFENIEEAAAFYAVFNFTSILDVLESGRITHTSIVNLRSALEAGTKEGSNIPYSKYHSMLCGINK